MQRVTKQSGPTFGPPEMLHSALLSWGSPNKCRQNVALAASILPFGGPKAGRKCYVTLCILGGSPRKGDKSKAALKRGRLCFVTRALLGIPENARGDIAFAQSFWAQKRAQMLHHPCLCLGIPNNAGD